MELKELNELIIATHNWHYISSPTGLINPKDSPNGNQIYHLYSTGEISFQKGGWAYLQRGECFIEGKLSNYQKIGLSSPFVGIQDNGIEVRMRDFHLNISHE